MADLKGTPLKDVVTVKSSDRFDGLEGDDEITLQDGATGQGGAGNDKITVFADANGQPFGIGILPVSSMLILRLAMP